MPFRQSWARIQTNAFQEEAVPTQIIPWGYAQTATKVEPGDTLNWEVSQLGNVLGQLHEF